MPQGFRPCIVQSLPHPSSLSIFMRLCRDYWGKVPDDFWGRVHFYNTAFSRDIRNASHPLNIMRSLYKPGDLVVLKLDIDNAPLELNVLEAIENDSFLLHMIFEMFFEMHYDHAGALV